MESYLEREKNTGYVNEPRFKQCGVTPHFSTRQKPLKKDIEKRKILVKAFKKTKKRY